MSTKPLSGSELEDIKLMAQKHFWPHAKPAGDVSTETGLKTITKGEGVWLFDENEQPWYDTTSCLWLVNLGHGRTDIADAAYEQMKEVSFTPMGSFSPPTAKLSGKIATYAPDKESRVFFVSGGAEANETAIKMARKFHINNGEGTRYKVISRRNSYHGATYATMSMGGGTRPPYEFEPLMPGSVKIANYDSYRLGFGTKSEEQASEEYAKDLERAILGHNPSTISAFIAEPISTATGIHVPNKAYFQMIREICETTGAKVDIEDDGTIKIAASDTESSEAAQKRINDIVAEAELGVIYTGKVVKTVDFGAFVNFLGTKDGLVHISELQNARTEKTTDICKEGDEVKVKVIGFDDRGKVKLSMKRVNQDTGEDIENKKED